MTPLQNDRLLRAILGKPVDVTPVWLMRQAGRYLPEYRATREKAGDFMTLCSTPELACEVTLQPLARFPLDAAILFSDILTIPDAMGLGLYFTSNEGPKFKEPLRTEAAINALGMLDPEVELRYVMDAVRLIRTELHGTVPLIGFAGSPWTLAVYMVEGGSTKSYTYVKAMLYETPSTLHNLLKVLADNITLYLNAQVSAGAQVLMLFDTWGGVLTPEAYQEFSLAYLERIFAGLVRESAGQKVPVILFTKGGGQWLEQIANSGCDVVGLDWTTDIGKARAKIGNKVALQGNLEPAILYASPETIRNGVANVLASYGHGSGHIFNLGHGVAQGMSPEHIKILVQAVHELSKPYHQKI
ncbi:uroporphyrinogen decarboxylase [Achromatium sp. WMS1]|nr:uroporphyrinogen decarboxylase [Achromatium sp. WMS1]